MPRVGDDNLLTVPKHPVSTGGTPEAHVGGVAALLRQMVQYLGVSGVALAVDFGTMTLLIHLAKVNYIVAATFGFCLGLAVNYALSRLWVFAGQSSRLSSRTAEFGVFAVIGVVGLVLNDLIIWAVTEGFGLNPLVSKLLATGVVFFWNFLLRRHLLFR